MGAGPLASLWIERVGNVQAVELGRMTELAVGARKDGSVDPQRSREAGGVVAAKPLVLGEVGGDREQIPGEVDKAGLVEEGREPRLVPAGTATGRR